VKTLAATTLLLLAFPAAAGGVARRSGPLGRCGLDALPADAPAAACLGCHEQGEAAPRIAEHASHPWDVAYQVTRRRASPLRPAPAALARGVVMPDGRVTCLSCHAAASRERFRLRLPQDDGPVAERLCQACHVTPGDEEGVLVALGERP